MAVSTTTSTQKFVLDGVEDEFSFTFRALTSAPEDIKCYVTTNSTDTALVYTTDYTVAINSDGVGGKVTLVAPATVGTGTLTVYRDTTLKQQSDYDDYNQFPANTIEEDLDRLILIAQEHSSELDRAVKLPVTTNLTNSTLLLPVPVAGKALKWNDAADSLVNTDVDIDTAIAAALASQVAAATSATTAASHATTTQVAVTYANSAATYAATAQAAATTATTQATAAATSATTSASHATSALTHATTAQAAATTATTQANAAATYATTAQAAATTATTAQTSAQAAATTATTQASTASTQATAAATSATTAASHATTAVTAANSALSTLQVAINTQTGNYTLVSTDVNKLVDLNTAGACTLTIPTSSAAAIPTGSVIAVRQLGAGQVTITTASGVTLYYEIGLKTTGQYAIAALLKTGTNIWLAMGSLES